MNMKYLAIIFFISVSKLSFAANESSISFSNALSSTVNVSLSEPNAQQLGSIKECKDVFNKIESMNSEFAQDTQETLIMKNIDDKMLNLKNLLELLPDENKKETCANILVQIESLLPGILELKKAAKNQ
ncbi:hypothetical protein [Thorsellia kenyensis]|uniref:Secreted protein n=1 Tax=Thorsellia kenyensis TaxID=1549888 RepID=A0ABV6CCL0_9GAMM